MPNEECEECKEIATVQCEECDLFFCDHCKYHDCFFGKEYNLKKLEME